MLFCLFPEQLSSSTRRQRNIDQPCRVCLMAAKWIEGMLKAGAEQHSGLIPENIFGAIAMMYVEIHYGNTLKPLCFECMGRSHRNIVEVTKSHGTVALRMVSRRAYRAKSSFNSAIHHQIHPVHNSSSCPQRGIQCLWHHQGVSIQGQKSLIWCLIEQASHIVRVMHPFQLLSFNQRGFMGNEYKFQSGHDQLIMDGVKSSRSLRVMLTDIV